MSNRDETFASREDAYERHATMIREGAPRATDEQRAQALERLDAWLDDQLIPNERAGQPDKKGVPEGPWRLREPRRTTWAFLSWDV